MNKNFQEILKQVQNDEARDCHATARNDAESGRSMVEMLGVLAIMGVLSVAGITGYSSAMDKHRANELMNAVSMRLMVLATQRATGTALSLAEFDNAPVSGSTITLNTDNQDTNTIELKLSNLPKAVCRYLYNSKGSNVISMKSGNIVLTSADGCAVKADALITFNNDLSETSLGNNGGIRCTEGEVCTNSKGFSGICNSSGKCDRSEICTQYDNSDECVSNGCYNCYAFSYHCVSESSDCETQCGDTIFISYDSSSGTCCWGENELWSDSAEEHCCALVGGTVSPAAEYDSVWGCCHPNMNGITLRNNDNRKTPICTSYAVEAAKGTPGYTCGRISAAVYCGKITAEEVSGYFSLGSNMYELTYPIFCWAQGYKYSGTTCSGSISDCTSQDVNNGYCPDSQTAALLGSL